jgi:hypothetical protein
VLLTGIYALKCSCGDQFTIGLVVLVFVVENVKVVFVILLSGICGLRMRTAT